MDTKSMSTQQKRKFLQTMLTKGLRAAKQEQEPVLLFYEVHGRFYNASHEEISKDYIESHPCSQQIEKTDLDL